MTRITPLLILLLSLASCKNSAEEESDPNLIQVSPEYFQKLGDFIQSEMADKDIPGLAISVTEADGRTWSSAYGTSDLDRSTDLNTHQIYRFASISKLFNATLIQQAVEEGQIEWDRPIIEYVPDIFFDNPYATNVTLRQLVSHKSGLIRESPIGSYFDHTNPGLEPTILSLVGQPVLYEPGQGNTKYSNAAVSVSGYVLSKVLGKSYESIVQDQLLQPLGMTSSTFEGSEVDQGRMARGFLWGFDRPYFEAPIFEMGIQPAANLYSSVEDLGLFSRMLMNEGIVGEDTLISKESLEKMWVPQFTKEQSGFGLGYHVSDYRGHRKVQHGGVMYGYASRFMTLPDEGIGVAVVSTVDCANIVSDRIANYATDLLLAEREGRALPDFETTQEIDETMVSKVVGVFKSNEGYRYEIFERGGNLYLDDSVSLHELRQRNDTLIIDSKLSFGPRFTLEGDLLTRLSDSQEYYRDSNTQAPLSYPNLSQYLGEFGWDHNHIFILEEDGILKALIEWFFEYPLIPVSQDVYKFPDYGLYPGEALRFERDANGEISGLDAVYVKWPKRETRTAGTFRINPVAPVSEIVAASKLKEPSEEITRGDKIRLRDLDNLVPQPQLDIRYATQNNFTGEQFYSSAKAFLVEPAADALERVARSLADEGLGLLIYDAYRPWYVTDAFFQATPTEMHNYVAKPHRGSLHNRGIAVDLGLVDLSTGGILSMPSGYDEFRPTAFPNYPGGTSKERYHRDLLRRHMESEGFTVEQYEWWHFNYDQANLASYPVRNETFEEL